MQLVMLILILFGRVACDNLVLARWRYFHTLKMRLSTSRASDALMKLGQDKCEGVSMSEVDPGHPNPVVVFLFPLTISAALTARRLLDPPVTSARMNRTTPLPIVHSSTVDRVLYPAEALRSTK